MSLLRCVLRIFSASRPSLLLRMLFSDVPTLYRPCNEAVVRGGICRRMCGEGWGSTPMEQTGGTVLWTWLDLSHSYVSLSFPSSELLKIQWRFFFFCLLCPVLENQSREKWLKTHKLNVVMAPVMLSESSRLPKTETWLTGKNHITPERPIPAAPTPSPHTHLCWNGDDECEETVLAKAWVWDLCAVFWVEIQGSWDVSEEMRRLWGNVVKPTGRSVRRHTHSFGLRNVNRPHFSIKAEGSAGKNHLYIYIYCM